MQVKLCACRNGGAGVVTLQLQRARFDAGIITAYDLKQAEAKVSSVGGKSRAAGHRPARVRARRADRPRAEFRVRARGGAPRSDRPFRSRACGNDRERAHRPRVRLSPDPSVHRARGSFIPRRRSRMA